jgi:hypothetical protein
MRVVATAPIPGIMTPSFPVAGLMVAAACAADAGLAAGGVDMLGSTLLCCDFSVGRKVQYLAVREGAQTEAVFMRALAVTRISEWRAISRSFSGALQAIKKMWWR